MAAEPRTGGEPTDVVREAARGQAEPPQERTVQQQQKRENQIAQLRREEGLESTRSRSSSRRDRRKRIRQAVDDGKHMKTSSLEALEEADAAGEATAMQPFERIGPDSTSMDGPVTHARAMRGEIPVRGSNPDQPYYMPQQEKKGVSAAPPTPPLLWGRERGSGEWKGCGGGARSGDANKRRRRAN